MSNIYWHFGIRFNEDITPKYMTKDNFAVVKQNEKYPLNDIAINGAKNNYDLNIEYFNKLDQNEFNHSVDELLSSQTFLSVEDLDILEDKKGIYVLVLDNYKQIYIGQTSSDLKKRIVKHLKYKTTFRDVPKVHKDTLPIDAFKPMDITRIFVILAKRQFQLNELESELIANFPSKFLLNKTIGGKANSYLDLAIRLTIGRIKKDI